MVRVKTEAPGAFGRRLAQLRKAAGYTQTELAHEIGATRRMIAYYETESDYPLINILAALATALKVTTDELLGLTPVKRAEQLDDQLLQRMQQIQQLDAVNQEQVIQAIDEFIVQFEHE